MDKELLKKELVEIRHHLHQHPEAAMEEYETSKFVAEKLKEMGYEDVVTGVGGTGVVATLKNGDGKGIIGFRADMDCIKMQEQTGLPYASLTPERMHACGHDGHTTTLLGLAKLLIKNKHFNGTVRLVFQPGEEPGWGAKAMIDDGLFERFPMDEIYGLHNWANFAQGQVGIARGPVMASEDDFKIVIKGKGGHASSPHMAKDALVIAAEIIIALQTIVSRNIDPLKPAVVSCTEIHTDGVMNAIPSTAIITGDCRAYETEVQDFIEKRMEQIVKSICEMNGAEYEFEYIHAFVPTVNAAECAETAAKAAISVLGSENVLTDIKPITASEDFAMYQQRIPGCFFFLGNAKDLNNICPAHNPHFDYNDDILLTGAEIFEEIARIRLM